MKQISYENFFIHFSNKTKLAIISALMSGPLSVNEIVEKTGKEQSNVSHQLKSLVRCSILNVKQNGKQRIYSLNKKTVSPMLYLVKKHLNVCSAICEECGMCIEER